MSDKPNFQKAVKRLKRLSRKAVKLLAAVETDKLTEAGKRDYFTHLSIQGALQHLIATKWS